MIVVIVFWVGLTFFKAQEKTSDEKDARAFGHQDLDAYVNQDREEVAGQVDFVRLASKLQRERVDRKEILISDPFKSLAEGRIVPVIEKEIALFELNGIVWDQGIPQALINEKMVLVGDIIAGYMVKKIEVNRVLLVKGDKERTLYLFSRKNK